MNILIFGITGMLGNAMFSVLSKASNLKVFGTQRKGSAADNIIQSIDVDNNDDIIRAFSIAKPDVVINCIGLIKQLGDANDPLKALPINSMLPHRMAKLSEACGARFIHYSTDCVFSGQKGFYTEDDISDCHDLYGKSKFIGEVSYPNSLTLRTSVIGHELNSSKSLVDWFLSQKGEVKGYSKAIFSGLTTYEHAKVIRDIVLPNKKLSGLYHLAVQPIDKYKLLTLIASIYKKDITIHPDDGLVIDRSLDASKFYQDSGYNPPSWETLITEMHDNLWKNKYV